jgi:dTDP-glucose pyrophosphorylase
MKILIAMAGDGKRFVNAGYNTIKPLIEVQDKTILEWTTQSLPFIKHHGKSLVNKDYELAFAIRTEHDVEYGLADKLKNIYGDVKIQTFDKITRGNLETALISVSNIFGDTDEELLILDADNHYNGQNFLFYKNTIAELESKQNNTDFGSICYFYPKDDVPKWCFAKLEGKNSKVISLHEKDFVPNSFPMVGVFYFSKTSLFLKLAKEIIDSDTKVKNEFYMSQAVQKMLDKAMPVYGIMVTDMVPLGTPEDVEEYGKFLVKTKKEQEEINNAREDRATKHQ